MKHKILLVVISVLLILGIFGASFQVRSVKVTGNRTYTAEEIEELVFPTRLSRNPVAAMLSQSFGKKQKIPFVEDYRITLFGPSEAEIIVYEKSMVGYISYMSSLMYFDKDGIVVESARQKLPGIPEVTGLHFGQIVLYKPLPVDNQRIFSMILNLTQTLSTYNIPAERIRYDRDLNATLTMGETQILLGGPQEMNGKIAELSNIYPKIQGAPGTLDLSDYDPTVANRMYSFRYQQR